MNKLPHLNWVRAFEAASRHCSFTRAAEELNLTPAAVSQQIKLLEQQVGEPLFRRLPRGVALTDMGHAYAQPVHKAFAEMQSATADLFGASRSRTIRVQASISFAALVLAPRLNAFFALHPDINVRLTTAVWTDHFDDDAVDVEVRYGHGNWDEPDIRHLGHQQGQIVCHPATVEALGKKATFPALAAQAIQIIGSEADWEQMARLNGLEAAPVLGRTKVDSSLMALQMITAGYGAAIVSQSFARHYLESGQMLAPLRHRIPLARSFFLIVHNSTGKRREVDRFCDWLRAAVSDTSASGPAGP